MKKIVLYFLFQLFTTLLFGQNDKYPLKVPQAMLDKFKSVYPNATHVFWSNADVSYTTSWNAITKSWDTLVSTHYYSVSFEVKPESFYITIDANGEYKQIQIRMPDSLLPQKIHEYLNENYKGYITEDEYRSKTYRRKNDNKCIVAEQKELIGPDGSKEYELRTIEGDKEYFLNFDGNGKFLRKKEDNDVY